MFFNDGIILTTYNTRSLGYIEATYLLIHYRTIRKANLTIASSPLYLCLWQAEAEASKCNALMLLLALKTFSRWNESGACACVASKKSGLRNKSRCLTWSYCFILTHMSLSPAEWSAPKRIAAVESPFIWMPFHSFHFICIYLQL